MKKGLTHPKWWLLFLLAALISGLFLAEANADFSEAGHTFAEAGLVLVLFGATMLWINANQFAILSDDWEEYKNQTQRR